MSVGVTVSTDQTSVTSMRFPNPSPQLRDDPSTRATTRAWIMLPVLETAFAIAPNNTHSKITIVAG